MNQIIEKLNQPKVWLQRRVTRLGDHRRQLVERSNKALTSFEENVLTRVADLLSWAHSSTGERSNVLRKTRDYVAERIKELQAEPPIDSTQDVAAEPDAPETIALAEQLDADENDVAIEELAADPAAIIEDVAVDDVAVGEEVAVAPFADYDQLNVKKLAARFGDLDADTLRAAQAYEAAHKGRKTVFEAIEKRLAKHA